VSTAQAVPVEFVLNGRAVRAQAAWPQETLLDFLRREGLTGAKEGCAEGECGACAVALVAADNARTAYRVVNSCLMFLSMAADHEIYTVESLAARGELADAQRAMASAGGSQCGYCTPGFVMSLFAEQYRPGRVGACDPLSMAGNLCRCTGYRPIRDAALAVGDPPPGPFADRLTRAAPRLQVVKSGHFARPVAVDECVNLLAADPDSRVVCGATDLGVEANLRGHRWPRLIAVEAIEELKTFSETATAVTIGAALALTDIGRYWTGAPPVLGEWLALFASPPIRNRATLGGNLATASPIGDAAPLLAALDARVHVAGPEGRRTIDVASFFTAYRKTALRRGEIVTAVEIPKPLPEAVRFYKVAKRAVDDISTVAAAMAIDRDDRGTIRRARFAFGGVAATPLRVVAAEEAVTGREWNEHAVGRVQQVLERTLAPMSDHRGSAAYRLEVSKSLIEKFWWEERRPGVPGDREERRPGVPGDREERP
jgi:xanthine dehydrogenase small subunit